MVKTITFLECTPKGSLQEASKVLLESGLKCEFIGPHMVVYYDTDNQLSHIRFLMDCCDINCPYRESFCPDTKCHRHIII